MLDKTSELRSMHTKYCKSTFLSSPTTMTEGEWVPNLNTFFFGNIHIQKILGISLKITIISIYQYFKLQNSIVILSIFHKY